MIYTNADRTDRKSNCKFTIRFLIKIAEESIYQCVTKQISIFLFITETEYIAVSETSYKIISICDILQGLDPEFT